MKWNIEMSEQIKKKIAEDEKLMRKLSESVDGILRKHGIEFRNMSYVFEPRAFTMSREEAPEVMMKSRGAMLLEIVEDLYKRGFTAEDISTQYALVDPTLLPKVCLPLCGIPNPFTLRVLDELRIVERLSGDPRKKGGIIIDMMPEGGVIIEACRWLVGNKVLLTELSESIFRILEEHGIKFGRNEGCVFTPFLFEKPIFAQKVSVADTSKMRGFGPQVYAGPTPQPAIVRVKPLPGIISAPELPPIPGVIFPPWWWIGIPAPEMLRALDMIRKVGM